MSIEGLPRVFNLSDVAERWDCSEAHVRKVVETGELRAFRIGKLWRIRGDAIDEFEARAFVQPSTTMQTQPEPVAPRQDPNPALTRVRLQGLRDRSKKP